MSARYIELESVATSTKSRQFNVPDETVAPRGYNMLYVLSNGGVPSEAIWVRIE
jgi:hypothetical protein